MQNHEVIPAFEMLLDEIDELINDLNQQVSQFLTNGKFDEARSLIAKVESITIIHDKVHSLLEEWRKLQISSSKKPARKTTSRKQKTKGRLERGLRTPEEAFKIPLLKTLIEMGGAG